MEWGHLRSAPQHLVCFLCFCSHTYTKTLISRLLLAVSSEQAGTGIVFSVLYPQPNVLPDTQSYLLVAPPAYGRHGAHNKYTVRCSFSHSPPQLPFSNSGSWIVYFSMDTMKPVIILFPSLGVGSWSAQSQICGPPRRCAKKPHSTQPGHQFTPACVFFPLPLFLFLLLLLY